MNIIPISNISALSNGADLWIIPQVEQSQWSKRLDWYLNFQIGKAVKHKLPTINPILTKILHDTELENEINHKAKNISFHHFSINTLLIAPGDLLPAKHLVLLNFENNLRKWVEEISNVWTQLGLPSLRIFIPQNIEIGDFNKEWELSADNDKEISVVIN